MKPAHEQPLHEFLTEEELMTLDYLVANERQWGLITKLFRRQIDTFWNLLRLTPIVNEAAVTANHKLAVGVEMSLGNFIAEVEEQFRIRRAQASETKE